MILFHRYNLYKIWTFSKLSQENLRSKRSWETLLTNENWKISVISVISAISQRTTLTETPEYIMWLNLMILIWFRIPVVVKRISSLKFRPQVSKRFVILETTSLLQVQRKISIVQSAACSKSMFYDGLLMNVTVQLCLTGSRWGDNVLSSL